jgi:hypothetical protein
MKRMINPDHLGGGIYKLNCQLCEDFYIGQTKSFFDRMGQHIGDLRQKRMTGALTPHYLLRHQFQGFPRQNPNSTIHCQPLWKIQDAATKDMIETAVIYGTHQGGHLLNKDFGPAPTPLTLELAKIFPELNPVTRDYETIPALAAKPTATRNGIYSVPNPPNAGNTATAENSSQQVGLRVAC